MYNYITTKTPKLCPQIDSRVVTLKTDLQLLISIKSTLYASPFLDHVDDDDERGFDDADNHDHDHHNRHDDDSDHDDHYAAH